MDKLPIIKIRQTIQDGMKGHLGTYRFVTGEVVPAIAVLKSYDQEYPPAGTSTEGIEVVLMFPQVKASTLLGGHDLKLTWYLFLKQWDFNESTTMAVQSLVSALNELNFLKVENIFTNPSNRGKNQPETVRIELSTYRFVA